MAAKTPVASSDSDYIDPHNSLPSGQRWQRKKHMCFRFDDIDTSDTWDTGLAARITDVAWQPVDTSDNVAATVDTATGVVTFTGESANNAGFLHLWLG